MNQEGICTARSCGEAVSGEERHSLVSEPFSEVSAEIVIGGIYQGRWGQDIVGFQFFVVDLLVCALPTFPPQLDPEIF